MLGAVKTSAFSFLMLEVLYSQNVKADTVVVCASRAFLLSCLLLCFLHGSDGLVSKWYF